jgi:membrane protein YqaA with SNARE-associated domain
MHQDRRHQRLMENITFFVERYGVIAVFLNVLLDEGGLPLPSYPLLAIAGALSVGGRPQLVLVLVAALCASVLADSTWYWIARRHGRKVFAQLCRITVSPDNCIRKTEAIFLKIGPGALLFVKFIPGLSNITVSLAGVTGVRLIACLTRLQATSTRGVRDHIRRVAGCATSTGFAGHAGATANLKLTFHPDRSVGANHSNGAFHGIFPFGPLGSGPSSRARCERTG